MVEYSLADAVRSVDPFSGLLELIRLGSRGSGDDSRAREGKYVDLTTE